MGSLIASAVGHWYFLCLVSCAEAVAVYVLWSLWLWGFSNCKQLWHPTCTVAFSCSTADLFSVGGVKIIVYNSSWTHFLSADSELIRHINKAKWRIFYQNSFEMKQPPVRRNLTNTGKLPRSSLLPRLFLERGRFSFCKTYYGIFV